MPDATDADHRPTPARPVPRSAGQLSDAAPDRRRGSIAVGVRVSWWYSLVGLAMLIGMAHALMLVPLFVLDDATSARTVLIVVSCVASAAVQLAFSTGMRHGMGTGVDNRPVAVAGFNCTIDAAELPDAPASRTVFGRVLREATTNVLRHGTPGPVGITIGRGPADSPADGHWVLTVDNAATAGGGSSSSKEGGSGLAGLRERVTEAGGTLTSLYDEPAFASPDDTGRFTLTATIPDADADQEVTP